MNSHHRFIRLFVQASPLQVKTRMGSASGTRPFGCRNLAQTHLVIRASSRNCTKKEKKSEITSQKPLILSDSDLHSMIACS
jgi:hypothetical protein